VIICVVSHTRLSPRSNLLVFISAFCHFRVVFAMVVKIQTISITAVSASTMTAAQRFIYLPNICRKSITTRS
jgi:hypothetical protein